MVPRLLKAWLPAALALAIIGLFGLASVWLGAAGTTWHVNVTTCPAVGDGSSASPFCKIQDAICVAVSGDTVLVARGDYHEAIRVRPGIVVVSAEGAAVTTIDATGQYCTESDFCTKKTVYSQCSVATFASGHTWSTRLEGFTLTGGAGTVLSNRVAGGGLYLFSSPMIVNNVITGNVLSGPSPQGRDLRGAGAYIAIGGAALSNNTIAGNRAVPPAGASGAVTYGYGGGVWVGFSSSPTLTNNVIQGNVAGDSALTYSLGAGGGVVVWPGTGPLSPVVDRNLIADNFADSVGGGLAMLSLPNTAAQAVVTNNVVVGNNSTFGGGVYTYFVKSRTANNTITGNEAFLGGGFYNGQGDPNLPVSVTNNIIEGNTLRDFGTGGGLYTLDLSATFDPNISNNLLWGNERNQCGGERTDATCIGVQGNFSGDPRYLDRAARNFRLDPNSPAIDRGNAAAAPPVDFENRGRGVDGNGIPDNPSPGDIDVGAHEFQLACIPQAEVCDNLDNDCNLAIDDGLGSTTCGTGACLRTVQNCVGGVTQSCVPGAPVAESCDTVDNDCNGIADDGLGSTTCGVGACQVTVQNCVGGVTQSCTPGSPTAEICDGFDNNCDGTPDEGLGTTTCGIGGCQVTVDNCTGGMSQSCTPGTPAAEVCDGSDNDCNGTTDEGLGASTCGLGECQRTVQNCVGGATQSCVPGTPGTELCNGLDDSCDGAIDEGFPNQDADALPDCTDPDDDNDLVDDGNDCAPLDATAFAPPADVLGVDIPGSGAPTTLVYGLQNIGSGTRYEVISGLLSRVAATDSFQDGFCLVADAAGGSWADPRMPPPANDAWFYLIRAANGCGLGTLGSALRDAPGSGDVCQTGRVDSDADGAPDDLDCSDSDPSLSPFNPEICDGLDNNCDTAADENNPGGGQACGTSVGTCSPGTTVCSAGALSCVGAVGPEPETCDGLDNDCDGLADNNLQDFDLDGQNDCVDADDDNDTVADAADCAPLNNGVWSAPFEVAGFDFVEGPPGQLVWTGQGIGPATLYDLAGGTLTEGATDFGLGACLASVTGTSAPDPRGSPPANQVFYYLVRARNACGASTYGSAARDALPACP